VKITSQLPFDARKPFRPSRSKRRGSRGETVKHTGLSDPEIDIANDMRIGGNPKSKYLPNAFKDVSALREFLDSHDFLEFETPVLQTDL
jgi:hypothetical protein